MKKIKLSFRVKIIICFCVSLLFCIVYAGRHFILQRTLFDSIRTVNLAYVYQSKFKISNLKKTFSYVAKAPSGKKIFVRVTGSYMYRSSEYDDIIETAVSDTTDSFCFIAVRGGKQLAVFNGSEGEAYRRIRSLSFDPDFVHYGYGGEVTAVSTPEFHGDVVIDGKKVYSAEAIKDLIFSEDAMHFTASIADGISPEQSGSSPTENPSRKWLSIYDGKAEPESTRRYYAGFNREKYFFRRYAVMNPDGKTSHTLYLYYGTHPQDALFSSGLSVSADNKHYADIIIKNTDERLSPVRYTMLIDGVKSKPYDYIGEISFSPDGLSTAAVVGKGLTMHTYAYEAYFSGEKNYILFKGKLSESFDSYTRFEVSRSEYNTGYSCAFFSADGSHYVAQVNRGSVFGDGNERIGGKEYILYDGKLVGPFDTGIMNLAISADGLHYFANVSVNHEWFFTIDGKRFDSYESVKNDYQKTFMRKSVVRAAVGKKWYVLDKNGLSSPFDYVYSITPNKDFSSYAAVVGERGGAKQFDYEHYKRKPYFNGRTGSAYTFIRDVEISDDGKHFYATVSNGGEFKYLSLNCDCEGSYRGYAGGTWYAVHDFAEYGPFEWIDVPYKGVMNPDGKHFLINASKGGELIDSGYPYKDGQRFTVHDGRKSPSSEYVDVSMMSADGIHSITVGRYAGSWIQVGVGANFDYQKGLSRLIIDGKIADPDPIEIVQQRESKRFRNIIHTLSYKKQGSRDKTVRHISFVGNSGSEISEVEENEDVSVVAYIATLNGMSTFVVKKIKE